MPTLKLSRFPLQQGKLETLKTQLFFFTKVGLELKKHYALCQHDANNSLTCSDTVTHALNHRA